MVVADVNVVAAGIIVSGVVTNFVVAIFGAVVHNAASEFNIIGDELVADALLTIPERLFEEDFDVI